MLHRLYADRLASNSGHRRPSIAVRQSIQFNFPLCRPRPSAINPTRALCLVAKAQPNQALDGAADVRSKNISKRPPSFHTAVTTEPYPLLPLSTHFLPSNSLSPPSLLHCPVSSC